MKHMCIISPFCFLWQATVGFPFNSDLMFPACAVGNWPKGSKGGFGGELWAAQEVQSPNVTASYS